MQQCLIDSEKMGRRRDIIAYRRCLYLNRVVLIREDNIDDYISSGTLQLVEC